MTTLRDEQYQPEAPLSDPSRQLEPPSFDAPENDSLLYSLGQTVGYIEKYIEQRVEYTKLEATEILAISISSLMSSLLIAFFGFIALILLSLALGLWLGAVLDSMASGFAIVGGFYILIGVVLYIFRERLILANVLDHVLAMMFKRK